MTRLARVLRMFPNVTAEHRTLRDLIPERVSSVTWRLERVLPSVFRIVVKRADGYQFACDFEDIRVRRWALATLLRACACQPFERKMISVRIGPQQSDIMDPEPPFPIGSATNSKREGWKAYFAGRSRYDCPFPSGRRDLQEGYREGWDAAKEKAGG